MERKVNIQDWQKVTVEDFNNFGLFPRASFDHVVVDTLIPSMAYTGFTTVQTAPAVVTVGNGRLYHNGLVFYNDSEGGASLDLLGVLPVVTRRYVGVVVWGQEIETDTEPRTFLTDPVTRATVARVVSTESRRWANISTVIGAEGPDPQHPSVASNTLAVAWILLDSTGIISIQMVNENRAPNLADLDDRLNEMDAWRAQTASRLDTLATDMAALAVRLNGTAGMKFVLKIATDVARVKEKVGLPDTYSMWGADHFLTTDESDLQNVDYLAKCEEGIRFPNAAEREAQFGLLNPMDPAVINQANFVLPVYDQVVRIEVLGKDSELYLPVSVSNDLVGALRQDQNAHSLGHADGGLLERRLVVRASRSRLRNERRYASCGCRRLHAEHRSDLRSDPQHPDARHRDVPDPRRDGQPEPHGAPARAVLGR